MSLKDMYYLMTAVAAPETGKNQLVVSWQPRLSSAHVGTSVSKLLSNYNSRLQRVIGPHKGL